MEKNWLELLEKETQVEAILQTNRKTERYGLVLSRQDAQLLTEEKQKILRKERRVEFGEGITDKIIYEFCDSAYIDQNHYVETLMRLQEIFYLYKNEMLDELTDSELLHFMKEQFETVCAGDLEYLESTCLSIFAQAVRAGYQGYQQSDGYGSYEAFDEVKRWDLELYVEALRELF